MKQAFNPDSEEGTTKGRVHRKNEEECEQTLQAIDEATGITDHHALYSTKEFKKVRVRYFTDEEMKWEKEHA